MNNLDNQFSGCGMNPQITSESIPKSPEYYEHDLFMRLLKLHGEIPWLIKYMAAFSELWNICEDGDQQVLIEELLKKFSYITSSKLDEYGIKIVDQINSQWHIDSSLARIIAFADNDDPDGSQFLLQSLKNKFYSENGWKEDNFKNKITAGVYSIRNGYTAILVDDFIGTGLTAERRLKWFSKALQKNNVKKCKIFIVALAAMESAKKVLDKLGIEDYFSCLWLKRGISDSYVGDELSLKIQSMEKFENLLSEKAHGLKLNKFKFGYKQSEALYYLEAYNIPNNVFPIFWWPKYRCQQRRNPIFRRLG